MLREATKDKNQHDQVLPDCVLFLLYAILYLLSLLSLRNGCILLHLCFVF